MANKFQHRAGAYGISGKFFWPISATLDIRPSVDLPGDGGLGNDVEENYNFHDLVSFRRAYTQVSGSPNDEPRHGKMVPAQNNLSLTVVEEFNLLHVIEVKKMVSRITTRWFEGDRDVEILLAGTRFEGFRIFGHEVIVKLATELFYENPTFSGLQQNYQSGGFVRDRFHKLSEGKEFPAANPQSIQISLVEDIIVPEPTSEFSAKGNVIDIPHVGKLFIAEMNITPISKSLNLIRWELGCPTGGKGNIGGGEGGGSPP